jgi:chorismate lyase
MSASSETILFPAEWCLAESDLRQAHPEAPWDWLLESGSLTQRLQQVCGDKFDLRLLGETDVVLAKTEAALLDTVPGAPARAREVQLVCGEVPCIYAFSLLPLTTLEGGGSYLESLGTRPLGDALFSDASLERGPIKVIMLKPGAAFYERVMRESAASGKPVWGRHSVFRTGGSPLLVCEFFLPNGYACTD